MKIIISSLVGAIIVFVFQAMSWMFLGIHATSTQAAANDEQVMTALNANMKESAVYDIPHWDMKGSKEDQEKMAKEMEGKPWARVIFHASHEMSMSTPMIRGFILDLLGMLMVAFIISKSAGSFGSHFMTAMYMAIYSLCLTVLMDWNWWSTPMSFVSGLIIDSLIIGVLSGLWMGWYWSRGTK